MARNAIPVLLCLSVLALGVSMALAASECESLKERSLAACRLLFCPNNAIVVLPR